MKALLCLVTAREPTAAESEAFSRQAGRSLGAPVERVILPEPGRLHDSKVIVVSGGFAGMPRSRRESILWRSWPRDIPVDMLGLTPAEYQKMTARGQAMRRQQPARM